ncbi:hypothetical protein Tco_0773107 [Tanacetum coccineum]|uniref:Uncharacterized protein n=1 Tax=Tanacetum coccineum TaxID=301880 RepID=A0ABQ4ZL33_9ASTR
MKFRTENSKKGYTPMVEKPGCRKSQVITKDMVLVYGAKLETELKVSCNADASFQTDKERYQILNGYIAAAEASMEAVWMRKFIDGLGGIVPSNKRPMDYVTMNLQ